MRERLRDSAAERGIHLPMSFEQALKRGDLDVARAILDELVGLPDTGGVWMPECYADLAREYDRQARHDDAIASLERAIELGPRGAASAPAVGTKCTSHQGRDRQLPRRRA